MFGHPLHSLSVGNPIAPSHELVPAQAGEAHRRRRWYAKPRTQTPSDIGDQRRPATTNPRPTDASADSAARQ